MYEVFISYRRSDGTELARSIKEILSSDYKVFFDHSSLRDGKWRMKLNQALEEVPVILCLMTRDLFGDWGKQGDCVQHELERAIEKNKLIIPVEVSGDFNGIPEGIPSKIKSAIEGEQFALVHKDQSFERDIHDIKERLRSVVERSREKMRRGDNEIQKAKNYLWGSNGKKRNLQEAFRLFQIVNKAIPYRADALVGIGLCFRENGQYDKAVDYFKQAGEKGNGEAYFLIAEIYEQIGESPIIYGKYYDLSANLDFAPALIKKGIEAKDSDDNEKALLYFNEASKLGNSEGYYQSALIYEKEGKAHWNTEKLQRALDLIQKAIDNGNAEAMNHLGIMYNRGDIIKRDNSKAFELVSKAADAGYVLAQFNKGCMLLDGVGVEKNKKLGKKWLEFAMKNGSEEAKKKLQEINSGIWHAITNLFG